MATPDDEFEATKHVMAQLLRQPPKPHEQMKLGKSRGKKAASPKARQRKAKK